MDKVNLFLNLFLLIVIVDGINCDSQCDCTTLADGQELIRAELFQIKLDNVRIKSRLRRLEVSRGTSTRGTSTSQNDGITSKAPQQNVDRRVSNDIAINNSKRIDAIDSTLTRVMTLLDLHEPKTEDTTDKAQEVVHKHRLDQIETKLESVSIKFRDLFRTNNLSNNMVARLGNMLKRTIISEKNNRIKFQGDIKDKIKSVNEINRTVSEHINDVDSTFVNLRDQITKTKTKISSLETATVKDHTDGAWSTWQGWSSCSATCGVGVQTRSRTCSNPKPSLLGKFCAGSPVQTRTCNTHKCKDFNVAFTAYWLSTSSSSSYSTLVFQSTHLNNGNAYNPTTGKFTCTIPGVYYFSVTLTKQYKKISIVWATLRINGSIKLRMYWDSYNDQKNQIELTPLTNSGTFHLMKNDVVYIYGKSNQFYDNYYSSTFTGFLITPD